MPASSRIHLITGASRGIGRAAAIELCRRGDNVIGTARQIDALADTAASVAGLPGSFHPAALELASRESIEQLVTMIAARFGRLDGLFGNGGILGSKLPLGSLPEEDFRASLEINITSSYRLINLLHPALQRSPAARILFATSGVAWKRHAGWTNYAIAKSAIEAMIGVYANEIAGSAMRANCLSPGPIRTELRVEAWPDEDPSTVPPPEELAPFIADLLDPKMIENGAIFDFKLRRFVRNRAPD